MHYIQKGLAFIPLGLSSFFLNTAILAQPSQSTSIQVAQSTDFKDYIRPKTLQDCQYNTDCLLSAAIECKPVSGILLYGFAMDSQYMIGSTQMEVWGTQSERCIGSFRQIDGRAFELSESQLEEVTIATNKQIALQKILSTEKPVSSAKIFNSQGICAFDNGGYVKSYFQTIMGIKMDPPLRLRPEFIKVGDKQIAQCGTIKIDSSPGS